MFVSKVKRAAIILLALGLIGAGAGFLGHRSDAEQPRPKSKSTSTASTKRGSPSPGADKPTDADKPYIPPPAVFDQLGRLCDWRDRLIQPIQFTGLDDKNTTLGEALDNLSKRYNIRFLFNERAFRYEARVNPLSGNDNIDENGSIKGAEIARIPIPPMKTNLRTLLQTILGRVGLATLDSEVMFLVRQDHIEITTSRFVRRELGFRNERPILPLVWDSFEETALVKILPRLAETSGYNVMADPKAGEKLQTKITVQLNNVPIDTAVRLLANMAGLSVVRLDNVFYLTTAENAERLREEQEKINADRLERDAGLAPPTPDKPTGAPLPPPGLEPGESLPLAKRTPAPAEPPMQEPAEEKPPQPPGQLRPPPAREESPSPIPGRKKPEVKPRPAKTPKERAKLLKLQVILAMKGYNAAFEGFGHTKRYGNVLRLLTENPEEVYIWSIRWLQAERKLSPKHEHQVAALEAHFNRMTQLKEMLKPLTADLVQATEVDKAEWYRLEAELWLGEAKAKATK